MAHIDQYFLAATFSFSCVEPIDRSIDANLPFAAGTELDAHMQREEDSAFAF